MYPASLGPSCWLSSRFGGKKVVTAVYRPLTWTAEITESEILQHGIQWYSTAGAADGWYWMSLWHSDLAGPEVVEWEWRMLGD
jgi:hypothetical protein